MRLSLLGLLLAGCSLGGESYHFISSVPVVDVADFSIWQTRGLTVGRAAQRYCLAGSARERAWMREAIQYNSWPAQVVILCHPQEDAR